MREPKFYDISIYLSAYSTLSAEELKSRVIAALLEPDTDAVTLDGQNETFEVSDYEDIVIEEATP